MNDKQSVIEKFVLNFIRKESRERSIFELSNPKKRCKFSNRLNHNWDSLLDMNLFYSIENYGATEIQKALKMKDDELCYVISNYNDFDNKILPFKTALNEIYGKGFASIIINEKVDKVYFEAEFVLKTTPRFIGESKR